MIGFAALLAYMSQCEKVNHAYTVSLSFVFLNVPKTLEVKKWYHFIHSFLFACILITNLSGGKTIQNMAYSKLYCRSGMQQSFLERLLPFHDIEHTDWQVAQGENKEHHHQHASCLPPGSDLFDLSTNRAGSNPHRLPRSWSWSWAFDRLPLPLQHWCASRNLLNEYIKVDTRAHQTLEAHWEIYIYSKWRNTHLLTPQLVTNLNVCQDHETQWCEVCDNEETGVVHLWVDLSCWRI